MNNQERNKLAAQEQETVQHIVEKRFEEAWHQYPNTQSNMEQEKTNMESGNPDTL